MSKKKFTLRTADGVAKEWHTGDEDIKIITPPDVIKAILINTPTDEKDFKFHAYIQNGDFIATSGGTRLRIPVGAPEHMNFRIPRATLEVVLAKVKSHKFNHDPKSDNAAHKLGLYWDEASMTGVFETDLFTETFKVIQPELNGLEIMDLMTDFRTVNKMPEYNQYAAFYDEIMERAVETAKIVDKRGVLGLVCNGYNFAYVSFDNALTEHGMAEMLIVSKQPEKDPLGLNNDKVADDTQTATQSEPQSGWIPFVKNGGFEDGQEILLTDGDRVWADTVVIDYVDNEYILYFNNKIYPDGVTHWQPLPQPPKE